MRYQIPIQAGLLDIETRREDLPLDELLAFASRQNPRRGFLFVSRVLGKHIPCAPTQMRNVYEHLAESLIKLPGPIVVVGMAETATGLGGGVADSLARHRHHNDVLFLHTTRHALQRPSLLHFDESHSHAPEHLLYAPTDSATFALFKAARSLVLVDDEISTGRTLRRLGEQLCQHLPALGCCYLASIVNWLSPQAQQAWGLGLPVSTAFTSLLEGQFHFQADPGFQPTLPPTVAATRSGFSSRADTGRQGLHLPTDLRAVTGPVPSGPLVVVGTGEFSFQPFLAAEALSQAGHDVLFQSTTRSPILEGEAVGRKLVFDDEYGEGVCNYLYNLPEDRSLILVYEQAEMAHSHTFPAPVAARWWLD